MYESIYVYIICICIYIYYVYMWKNRKVKNNKSRAFERDKRPKKKLPLGSPAARWQYLLVLPWSTRCPEPIPRCRWIIVIPSI